MDQYKITAEEFAKNSISRLATHPNGKSMHGSGRMTEQELKGRFDAQGELFRKKFNAFLSIIPGSGEGEALADKILTGIDQDHTLRALFQDIISESGRFASYLSVGDQTLLEKLVDIGNSLEGLNQHAANDNNPHSVTAEQVGLGNVDNTADEDKPISNAQKAAFNECVKRITTKQISVYTTDTEQSSSGKPIAIYESVSSGSIPKRGAGGCLKVGDPMDDQDAVNLRALQEILEAFVKKNAEQQTQEINGGLSIIGNVGVDGAISANDIRANRVIVEEEMVVAHNETMNVKDAYVVTNSEYSDLPTLSGYLINTPTLKTYGIVYDRVNDCVKIGIGSHDGTVFTFDEGEAQALATRGVIEGGHLPIWDSEKSSFVDSEVSVDDIATKKEIGLIDEALDEILAIQAELIGGDGV